MSEKKSIESMTDSELFEAIALDLVQMHNDTGIDLAHWEVGLAVVKRFYNVRETIEITDRKVSKAILSKKLPPAPTHPNPWSKEHENERHRPRNPDTYCGV